MNDFDIHLVHIGEEKEQGPASRSTHYQPANANFTDRVVELEIENSRLNRLVAELLIKNQQLRKPD
jgi:hypothetical protein